MDFFYRAHEWLADRIKWVQYPRPRIRSVSGHSHGWKLKWQTRRPMHRGLALFMPTAMLFVPYVGVYLAILGVIFLFAYFRRN